ncbi:ASCH domain-containing protein [Clostridium algoriphilum]|uniref:ASCH domain-containing protein n=1 Tax=Clostridium algoriphilum TaxID=198347 RepID=UPI001CF4017D|nr:ASCH domain-containing protein [Clostridium algoriphilum]MCB2294665.1 ASCH domain-containing protein [Clostridium algoriphilum]
MTEKEMWNLYNKNNDVKNKTYDAWSFGGDTSIANELAKLVVNGIKTGTASAYQLYELENSPLPPIGSLNIILDSDNNAICITETIKVYTCPFWEVSESHAFKEGEGDCSIAYWRTVHKDFFSRQLKVYDLNFDENMLIVCEEFKVVFK